MVVLKSLCDVHTHTLYSRHAYSTIEENVRSAAEKGLELFGSTDHFSSMLFPTFDVRNYQFYFNYKSWPRVWHGVRLLHGCEADIVDCDGHFFGYDVAYARGMTQERLSRARYLNDAVFSECDYVIASIHNREFAEGQTLARTTQAYLGALENDRVLILGHVGRAGVPFDLDEVLTAAKERHKLIEINEHSLGDMPERSKRCREIAERCAELGVKITISSDAHIAPAIGEFKNAYALLEEIHFPEELVATRSAEAFLEAMSEAGLAVPDFS